MSIKTNLLIAASVMSVVYITGVSNIANAVDQTNTVTKSVSSQLVAVDTGNTGSVMPAANAAGQHRYIIRFKEPALAQYNGVGNLAAIPRNADNSIQMNTSAVRTYVEHLEKKQKNFLTSVSGTLGRELKDIFSYQHAYNGMAVYLSKNEVNTVKSSSLVAEIVLDRDYILNTDVGPQLIGADNVWLGVAPAAGAALGEGVVIGTLDSGINFDHPSFADIGDDSYDHTNPLGVGNFLGVCDAANTDQFLATYTCNDKLIGGFDFVHSLTPVSGFDLPGPEDENGHGSHVAAISGGNVVTSAEINGLTGITVSGVAPHANVIMYDVCYVNVAGSGRCPGASSIAAVDQILADGVVNVINYSLSGGTSPWTDPVSQAFLSATDSGVFVAVSAGNSGPNPDTLGHIEPWTSSSGASTHSRRFFNAVNITGPGAVPIDLTNIFAIQGRGPALAADMVGTINYSGIVDATNVEGCNAFVANAFDGVVALISRGGCSFKDKVNNASAAGAIGVIVHNNVTDSSPFRMTGLGATTISSVMVGQVAGADMVTFITDNPTATVSVDAAVSLDFTGVADSMARFSSRGPSPIEYNKPDVTAPGVNILAAFHDSDVSGGTPAEYGVISGTSMSSPHNAGSAALLKELNPSWSAAEIKSAIMMTAVTAGVTKEDGVTPADPFDRGSGRVQVDIASSTGLVMHETAFRFLLADPANGGDPKTLNVPNLTNYSCISTCSFQRTFKSVAATSVDYTANLTGVTGTVNPATFTVNPGQTITLNIEVDGNALTEGAISFGELLIVVVPVDASMAILRLPAVIIGFPDQPDIDITPISLSATLQPDATTEQALTINNEPTASADLNWNSAASSFVDVFAEQVANGTARITSDFFTPDNSGVYSADDFVLSKDSSIETLFFGGSVNGANLVDVATAIEVRIFANLSGTPMLPAGHPEDGSTPVASFTVPITDTSLDLTDNNILIDVVAATGNAITLSAGTYWVTVFPVVNTVATGATATARWAWNQGAMIGTTEAVLIDPSNLFGGGFTNWIELGSDLMLPDLVGLNYAITGTGTCGASWLSMTPTTGVITPANSTDVIVTFDSTGLATGNYTATLCIDSDDPDEPQVLVPVSMTVEGTDLIFANGFETP